MAAAAVSLYLGAEMHTVCSGLAAFRNTQRRFEFYGERDGIKIYHDYAHHPAEAAAALSRQDSPVNVTWLMRCPAPKQS